ncbi:hypothetical protein QTI19_22145 [Variovorax sp. J22R203]|nr:hypothetical protein [Variovorax sp. J22R203]
MDYAKEDAGFRPRGDPGTTRWNISVGGIEREVLCTGAKFFDTRDGEGGAGAIDLVVQILGLPFKQAIRLLRERGV